jgi:hypothetical protein
LPNQQYGDLPSQQRSNGSVLSGWAAHE